MSEEPAKYEGVTRLVDLDDDRDIVPGTGQSIAQVMGERSTLAQLRDDIVENAVALRGKSILASNDGEALFKAIDDYHNALRREHKEGG